MFQIVGDDILFDGEKVGMLTVPAGTLRDAVTEAFSDRGYEAGYADGCDAGYDNGYADGCAAG